MRENPSKLDLVAAALSDAYAALSALRGVIDDHGTPQQIELAASALGRLEDVLLPAVAPLNWRPTGAHADVPKDFTADPRLANAAHRVLTYLAGQAHDHRGDTDNCSPTIREMRAGIGGMSATRIRAALAQLRELEYIKYVEDEKGATHRRIVLLWRRGLRSDPPSSEEHKSDD